MPVIRKHHPIRKGKNDYLRDAAGHYLSEFPEKWTGEQIIKHLESEKYQENKRIVHWFPFEGYDGQQLAEYIRNLAGSFAFYHSLPKP
jgi:hypothetical protein